MRSWEQTYFQIISEYFKVPEAGTECSCMQRTQVEDNLINGINPIRRDSNQCYYRGVWSRTETGEGSEENPQ